MKMKSAVCTLLRRENSEQTKADLLYMKTGRPFISRQHEVRNVDNNYYKKYSARVTDNNYLL